MKSATKVEIPGDLSDDLEKWMTLLPQELKTIPFINLAIPGSHDSFTRNISPDSDLSPDAEPILQNLQFLGPILKYFMSRWSRTQDFSVTDQLKNGIRYFDLRIATKKPPTRATPPVAVPGDDLYFVHGLYSVDVLSVFNEIEAFLESHPQEIVILDCQHFYAFTQADHELLMQYLAQIFGHKLLPYGPYMANLTLEYMTMQFRYQVVAIYRSDAARFGQPLLWPSVSFPNPWADTDSIPELITALNAGIECRSDKTAFISQCVLTPSSWFVVRNLFSTLREKCAVELEKAKYDWLYEQTPGPAGVNIVIADFVDMQDCLYMKEVVNLNMKLLEGVGGVKSVKSSTVVTLTPVDQ